MKISIPRKTSSRCHSSLFIPSTIALVSLLSLASSCALEPLDDIAGNQPSIEISVEMDWTAVVTQELAIRAGVAPGPLRVARNAVGTMRVRNVSDPTDEVVHDWHITYDADDFTMISNKTIVVSPGIYDFLFDVTIDNHQYVGEAAAVLIEDGADILVPMTVAAVIGDTDVSVEIVGVLPELRFSYPASELASLTAPAIGISIDGGAEQTLVLARPIA